MHLAPLGLCLVFMAERPEIYYFELVNDQSSCATGHVGSETCYYDLPMFLNTVQPVNGGHLDIGKSLAPLGRHLIVNPHFSVLHSYRAMPELRIDDKRYLR